MRCVALCVLVVWCCGCRKTADITANTPTPAAPATGFIKYTIKAGAHFANANPYTPVETDTLAFVVKFDSTAVYQAALPQNQYDINKLYGFSDNGTGHHAYSARFGWRWSDGALRLFAYVYNEGAVISEELGTVPIGVEIACRIVVANDRYLFFCNDQVKPLPRKSTTVRATGYLLYPYFGGDEPAPHDVQVWIKSSLFPGGGA